MQQNSLIIKHTKTLAETLNVDPQELQQVIVNTIMPAAASPAEVAAFMMVCNTYQLNPLLKEIAAFPTKKAGIMPVVMIDGWLRIMNSHPKFDGMEQEDNFGNDISSWSVTTKIYVKGISRPIQVTEYYDECYSGDITKKDQPWDKWPKRMLRHKSLIQAIRYALGISGIYDRDEVERIDNQETGLNALPAINNYMNGPMPQIISYGEIEAAVESLGLGLRVVKEFGKDIAYVNGNTFPVKDELNKLGFKTKKNDNNKWSTFMDVTLNTQQPPVELQVINIQPDNQPTVKPMMDVPLFETVDQIRVFIESQGLAMRVKKGNGDSKKFFALAEGYTEECELELQKAGFEENSRGMWVREVTEFMFLQTPQQNAA